MRESASRRELVDDVLRFAKASKAELVAVNTRRLLSRFPGGIGGFAEALIAKSALPVLAVSPNAKIPPRFKRILFATDFSRGSHRAFRRLLRIAKRLRAEVTILSVELPYELPFASPEAAYVFADSFLADAEKARQRYLQRCSMRWVAEAEASGVKCKSITVRGQGTVSGNILAESARVKADLICLVGNRGARTPALMGGTVREVLSAARSPVLEIHR